MKVHSLLFASITLMCPVLLESFARSSVELPISTYITYADTIYIIRVDSVKAGVATLSVINCLRGKTAKSTASIELTPEYPYPALFKVGSEWLILSCAPWRNVGRTNVVGGPMEETCGWMPFAMETKSGSNDGLTLSYVEKLLRDNPEKPWPK